MIFFPLGAPDFSLVLQPLEGLGRSAEAAPQPPPGRARCPPKPRFAPEPLGRPPTMAALPGTVPRMMRPAPGQNYPRTGFPLEGRSGKPGNPAGITGEGGFGSGNTVPSLWN